MSDSPQATERGHVAYIALGSNLGDRAQHLRDAIDRLRERGVTIVSLSGVEETEPLGPIAQGRYLNQMIAVRTPLAPRALLAVLHDVERRGGRVRDVAWGPRTIDLDIVRYDDVTCNEPDLVLPHPQIGNRAFWQREIAELDAMMGAHEHCGAA